MQTGDLQFLIADEDEFQRRWLHAMLANLGARHIVEVEDGREAYSHLLSTDPRIDIAFIDLKMPGMDGIELIRNLAAANQEASLILVSALDSTLTFSVAAMARACGVDLLGTIAKPASPEAIEALLRQYRSPSVRAAERVAPPLVTDDDVRHAVAAREFEPLFQPKVALATGHVHGMEAFARWKHPLQGWIAPAIFIPALERLGLMDQLSWMMLEKSVLALQRWRAAGHPLPVSINLSPSTLAGAGFADRVTAFLARENVAPENLIFEVTETAAVSNLPSFLENLARLRLSGCLLSVDDFGTGQASMQDLMRIPFSEVKIDRSYVAGAAQNESLELVLSSTIALCRRLQRSSVAVGVESLQDWEFLTKLGCEYAQGYYIARPMEASAVPAWLTEWAQFF